jgi:hypothetical protein
MGTRRTLGRVLFAVALGIVLLAVLVVAVTWGSDAGGSGTG